MLIYMIKSDVEGANSSMMLWRYSCSCDRFAVSSMANSSVSRTWFVYLNVHEFEQVNVLHNDYMRAPMGLGRKRLTLKYEATVLYIVIH